MGDRRAFLQRSIGLGACSFGFASSAFSSQIQLANAMLIEDSPETDATNEDYWQFIQKEYTVNPNIINLNNGGVSPAPRVAQEALNRFNSLANEGPSYYMWRIMDQGREPLRYQLAQLAGCNPDEIAINRNATEALNTVIFGLPLQKGDEVIGTQQDYPNMIQAWRQRQQREGIIYKQISFDFPIEND
ncbi:MAG: aminotransferase class V-fold PLP-dependent enzyme, partial [Chitinophagaceae bacterium]|nr:aminotransferase class V-fold PLP-dependent enzyme [Chitinophagaceae bacterium]